jgi:hypothetical protein
MAKASISSWDFHNFHVQQDIKNENFISAETTLVAATHPDPSTLPAGNETAYPIGILENAGISQSKQLQRIFEIGSSRSYFIPGRVVGSLSLGRIMYFGPSLLRLLYAYFNFNDTISPNLLETGEPERDLSFHPGYNDLFLNLGSDLFNYGFGLIIYFRGQTDENIGGIYLTQNYLQGHQLSISSGSVLLMEGASAQFDRIIPVKLN